MASLSLDELRRLVTIITNPVRYNVNTFEKSRQMRERYDYLLNRFPDPQAEPTEPGPPLELPDQGGSPQQFQQMPVPPPPSAAAPSQPSASGAATQPSAPRQPTAAIQMPVPTEPGL